MQARYSRSRGTPRRRKIGARPRPLALVVYARLVALCVLTLALWPSASASAAGDVLWRGDSYCSATSVWGSVGLCPDAGPWDVTACVPGASGEVPWSLENVLDPARPDRITGRFEVHQGDQGARGGGDRCELVEQTRDITGMDPAPDALPMEGGEVRVFKFQALYDASTQLPTTWQYQTVGQWHNSTNAWGCPTSSPLKIAITGPGDAKSLQVVAQECRGGLTYPERILYSTPLVTDTWQSWSFEIRWSPDPRTGYVRILHQGRPVVPAGCPTDGRCPMATQYSDLRGVAVRNHFKLGNYRDKDITVPTVVSYRAVTISLPG